MVDYDPTGPFINEGPPAIDANFLNAVEAALEALVAGVNAAAVGADVATELNGKINVPAAGGYNVILQYSTAIGDARVSADATSTSVLWITTYSGRPTNAAPLDQQKVVLP